MKRNLSGLRAIVTGASSGIGRSIATQLVAAGAAVVAVGRSAERLATLDGAVPVAADITRPDDRERIVATAIERLGGLDLLVNNAGITSFGHFADSTEAINRQMLETNFFAPAELTRLAVPHLRKGTTPCVAVMTSMCARRGMPAWPEYSASKFALMGLVEAWRAEFVRYGIDVVSTVPGLTRTGLHDRMLRNDGKMEIPFDDAMAADDVAAATLTAIRKGTTEVWLGRETKQILRLNKWAPRLTTKLIAKRVRRLYADS